MDVPCFVGMENPRGGTAEHAEKREQGNGLKQRDFPAPGGAGQGTASMSAPPILWLIGDGAVTLIERGNDVTKQFDHVWSFHSGP